MPVADAGTWVRALLDEGREGSTRTRLNQEPYVGATALVDLEFLNGSGGFWPDRGSRGRPHRSRSRDFWPHRSSATGTSLWYGEHENCEPTSRRTTPRT